MNLSLSHFLHAMLCRCSSYLQKTTNTSTLNGGASLSPIKVLFHVSFVINIVTFEYLTRVFFSFFLSPNFFIKRQNYFHAFCPDAGQQKGDISFLVIFLCLLVSMKSRLRVVPIFFQGQQSERNASARDNQLTRERRDAAVREKNFSLPAVSPFSLEVISRELEFSSLYYT